VTLLFGRVWCGWFCPLGTLLEWVGPRAPRPSTPPEGWRRAKYLLLALLVAAALLGSQALLFLDPITLLSRTTATVLWPALSRGVAEAQSALYRYEFLWPALDFLDARVVRPLFKGMVSVFTLAVPIALFFAGVVALNWVAERFWCRYLCPLGGLLGLVSRFSLVRREVGEGCALCARCDDDCPTGTIDPADGYRSDPAECIVCYDCIADCTREGVAFRWHLPGVARRLGTRARGALAWKPAPARDYDPRRRQVLAGLGAGVAVASLASVEAAQERTPAHLIRPPGARLTDFESLCVRCGECVRVCPTQGLQPSLFEGGVFNAMTPRLVPRLGYCSFSCAACGEVCPTGAVPRLPLEEKRRTVIGLARVDQSRCLPWAHDIPCIVCEEVCPVQHKAIWLEEGEGTDVHGESVTLLRPRVVKELCTGCGLCEYHCPMGGEAAIRVYSPTDAGGYVGGDPSYEPPAVDDQ
jgi:MauM/NapG family ferredoxin protein